MTWEKMRAGNPITGAITVYMRKHFSGCGGTIEVLCAKGTDIDGQYKAILNCPTTPEPMAYLVTIKHAAIVGHRRINNVVL